MSANCCKKTAPLFALAGVVIGALCVLVIRTDNDLAQQLSTQCEMHQLYIDTEGEFGWPDYDGVLAGGYCDV